MNRRMDRHKFEEANYITLLYEREEFIRVEYLHMRRIFRKTVSFAVIKFLELWLKVSRCRQSTSPTGDRLCCITVSSDAFLGFSTVQRHEIAVPYFL
jgi:hypothetical protein